MSFLNRNEGVSDEPIRLGAVSWGGSGFADEDVR
jgi:hypothetical protein